MTAPEEPAVDRGVAARQPRAIRTALSVLEAIAELGPGTSARAVSERLGLPRATTYRLLNLLVQDGYLVRTPDLSGFALGARVAELAGAAARPARPSAAARDRIDAARATFRGGVHVVAYVDGRIRVVDVDPDYPLRSLPALVSNPAASAFGTLLLREDVGAPGDPAPYALRVHDDQLCCVAVPFRDRTGALAGAVGFAGSRARAEPLDPVVERLRALAVDLAPLLV